MNLDKYDIAKQLFLEGNSPSKIAKQLQIPLTTLLYNLEKEGLYKRRRNVTFSKEQIELIKKLREKRYGAKRIARELNLPVSRLLEFVRDELSVVCTIKEINRSKSRRVKYSLNVNYFNIVDSEEKAYWLGFIFADGHLNRNRLTIKLATEDKGHLIRFSQAIEFTGNPVDKKEDTNFIKGSDSSLLEVNSTELVRALEKYIPSGKKSDKIRLPEWLDDSLLRHFIRGYFDGDGYVISTRKKLGFCGNIFFLQSLKTKFFKYGIVAEKDGYFQNRKGTYAELVFGSKASVSISRFMYENAYIYLERKKNDLNKNHSGCKTS
ncbi:LAGLIDADG family homing endonuclease [Ammoniphilus sp. CFH 90114]|uniref:LAGLIDADG family homing endonuclease n=1 Tax=Ammoniphilus sp. CFH 90114 TaxID=2493665 RepID=UPI00100F9E65|nr:LAGLIDADG family homing endonuclease [Ammoniphilus sp. CFH 90114]RXT13658.1 hypothetical protein EIZ39_05765 [Ammoniphilus sp. CFH 90114]